MTERVQVGGLQVAKVLFDFVNNEAIPGTGIAADAFWAGAEKVINDLAPKNKALLAKRDELLDLGGELFEKVLAGQVKIEVHQRFPLQQAAAAHIALEGRQTTGSTVLLP